MDSIGIKVKNTNQIAYCVKVFRKYTEMPLTEIKEKINNNVFVYECRYVDGEGIKKIISIYKEIISANIEAELFEHGRLTNINFLTNLSGSITFFV